MCFLLANEINPVIASPECDSVWETPPMQLAWFVHFNFGVNFRENSDLLGWKSASSLVAFSRVCIRLCCGPHFVIILPRIGSNL